MERSKAPKLFDSAKLRSAHIKADFTSQLEFKFQALYVVDYDTSTIETKWNGFCNAITETAEGVLGTRTGTREECISDETWTLINEEKPLKVNLESAANKASKVLFRNLHRQKAREVKTSVRRNERHYAHCKAEEAEEAANRNDQRKLFKIAKQLGGNSERNYNGVIKDGNGDKLTKDDHKKARWLEHFKIS